MNLLSIIATILKLEVYQDQVVIKSQAQLTEIINQAKILGMSPVLADCSGFDSGCFSGLEPFMNRSQTISSDDFFIYLNYDQKPDSFEVGENFQYLKVIMQENAEYIKLGL